MKKYIFLASVIILMTFLALGYQKYGTFSQKDRAWLVLEDYLDAARKHDVQKVKALSYQISEPCNNYGKTASSTADCDAKMDTVAFLGADFKKNQFKHIWSDARQIILTSELNRQENDELVGLSKAIIYFIIDSEGTIKLLKFNDSIGMSISKENRGLDEIDAYLDKVMADGDEDGMLDEIELCIGRDQTCKKTDPKNRDSDADGFWDGTEAQFTQPDSAPL